MAGAYDRAERRRRWAWNLVRGLERSQEGGKGNGGEKLARDQWMMNTWPREVDLEDTHGTEQVG